MFFPLLAFSQEAPISEPEKPNKLILLQTELSELQSKPHQSQEKYEKSVKIWREVVDLTLSPEQEYKSKKDKELHFSLLLKAGVERAKNFQACLEVNCTHVIKITDDFLYDFIRELKIIPYRILALASSKSVEINQLLESGLEGWVTLIKQLFILLFVFSLPFAFYYFAHRISQRIERFRSRLLHSSSLSYERRTRIALWILRINPYIKWSLMYAFVDLAHDSLSQSKLSELAFIIPFLKIYFIYRISQILLHSVFSYLFQRGGLESFSQNKTKIDRSVRRISRVIFIEVLALFATEDLVRRAIIYTLISQFVFYFNIWFGLFETRKWREEIWSLSRGTLPAWLTSMVSKYKTGLFSLFITPILATLSLTTISINFLTEWLFNFDFFKRIHSEIFKKRLQDASKKSTPPSKNGGIPEEYKNFFGMDHQMKEEAFVSSDESYLDKILSHIDRWINKEIEEDGFVLLGEKGIGKSVILEKVYRDLKCENKKLISVPPKITSKKALFSFLSGQLGAEVHSINDILEYDKNLKAPQINLFDNAQNLFLGTPHGFDAYEVLLDIVNLQTSKLFWLFTFDKRSWDHLQGIFGSNHIFGKVLEIEPWSDVEVQQLILKRHELSGYNIEFDHVIKAFQNEVNEGPQLETQFFRLLWGQARGNPRAAMALWLSSLQLIGEKRLKVGVPEFKKVRGLSEADDDTLFVYAAIVRHENISLKELLMVTHIKESSVKRAIKFGEDFGIIENTKSRFRITPSTQYSVNSYLLGKNFIYE